jgi:hypothetical protein
VLPLVATVLRLLSLPQVRVGAGVLVVHLLLVSNDSSCAGLGSVWQTHVQQCICQPQPRLAPTTGKSSAVLIAAPACLDDWYSQYRVQQHVGQLLTTSQGPTNLAHTRTAVLVCHTITMAVAVPLAGPDPSPGHQPGRGCCD